MARSKSAAGVWALLADDQPSGDPGRAAEDIAVRLEQFIIAREVPEGARLPSERDLALLLDTSRPTVSQAVRILVVKGLIESRHGSGAYVTRRPQAGIAASVDLMLSLNEKSVDQLGELRLGLETMGVEHAVDRATDAVIEDSREALDQLRENAGDTAAWMSADTHFHATLVRASGNPYLAAVFESVHATLINYEYRSWIERGEVPAWLHRSEAGRLAAVHEPILQAIRDRDHEAARIAVRHHHEAMAEHLAASRG